MGSEFVFNIPPTAEVIWRWCHGLVSSDGLQLGIELGTPGYKVSGLSTISLWLLCFIIHIKRSTVERGTCIKGLIGPPLEPKSESCFSPFSFNWFISRV